MEAAQEKAAEKPEFSEYDYSNFYYGAGDDPINLLKPYAEWYGRRGRTGTTSTRSPRSAPPPTCG